MDRMLARGVFPILVERPLEDTPVVNPPTAQVYVVEYGAYSDRYIDSIFATRELAEQYVYERARRGWSNQQRPFPEHGALSFDEWRQLADDTWGAVGSVEEYELWSVLPIAE